MEMVFLYQVSPALDSIGSGFSNGLQPSHRRSFHCRYHLHPASSQEERAFGDARPRSDQTARSYRRQPSHPGHCVPPTGTAVGRK